MGILNCGCKEEGRLKFETWHTESANRMAAFDTRAEMLRWLLAQATDQGAAALQGLVVGEPDDDFSIDAFPWVVKEVVRSVSEVMERSLVALSAQATETRKAWQPQGDNSPEVRLGTAETAAKVLPRQLAKEPALAFGS